MHRLRPTACVSMHSMASVCSAWRERARVCWRRSGWWYRRLEDGLLKKNATKIFRGVFLLRIEQASMRCRSRGRGISAAGSLWFRDPDQRDQRDEYPCRDIEQVVHAQLRGLLRGHAIEQTVPLRLAEAGRTELLHGSGEVRVVQVGLLHELRMMNIRTMVPRGRKNRCANTAAHDPHEVRQPRSRWNPASWQPGQRDGHERDEKSSHADALDQGGHHEREGIHACGVARAHPEHEREHEERGGCDLARVG